MTPIRWLAVHFGPFHWALQQHGCALTAQRKAAYRNYYQCLIRKPPTGAQFRFAQCRLQMVIQLLNELSIIFRAIWIYSAGLILFNIIGITIGLVMIANLENCDPFTAGIVAKLDQVRLITRNRCLRSFKRS